MRMIVIHRNFVIFKGLLMFLFIELLELDIYQMDTSTMICVYVRCGYAGYNTCHDFYSWICCLFAKLQGQCKLLVSKNKADI